MNIDKSLENSNEPVQGTQEIPNQEPSKEITAKLSPGDIQAIADRVTATVLRDTQSRTAKMINSVNKATEADLAKLKAAGIVVEPDSKQYQALVEQNQKQVAAQMAEELQPPGTPNQSGASSPDPNAQANAYVESLEKQYGFAIEDGDPELANIASDSPAHFISSMTLALETKKQRLLQNDIELADKAETRTTLGASGGSGKATGNTLATDIQELEKIMQNPNPGNINRMRELSKRIGDASKNLT
jgi:phosphotransferase system IIB component